MPDGAARGDVKTAMARVTLAREADVIAWCDRLNCTEAQLHRAVKAVGNNASQVEAHLSRKYGVHSAA